MFSKNRFSLFIIVFSFMIIIGVGLKAHFHHNATKPYLKFTSDPDITCNIDGWTFTHHRLTDQNGNIQKDFWFRPITTPEFKIEAEAHGVGYAHIILHGKYDTGKGVKEYGDPKNSTDQQLGRWINFFPAGVGIDHDVFAEKRGFFYHTPKEYSWSGEGSIKLIPWYWKSDLGVPIPVGSWEPAPNDDFHEDKDAKDASGSWTVKRNWKTAGSGSDDEETDEEEDSDDSEGTSPSPATVPDSPRNFEASPYRISILLRWDDPASDGGSPITDFQYQYRRKLTATSWTDWSGWTSGGTGNSTWITGLTANRRYSVQLRAVNSVGASSSTSQTVDTRK